MAEQTTDEYKLEMQMFDAKIMEFFSIKNERVHYAEDIPDWNRHSLDEDDPAFVNDFINVIDYDAVPHADDYETELLEQDNHTNIEIGLPWGPDGELHHARVKQRAVDVDGNPLGVASNNPITDTRLYDIEFLDGSPETISANVIAENLLSQVDAEGHKHLMLDDIIDHRCTADAISKGNEFYVTEYGAK